MKFNIRIGITVTVILLACLAGYGFKTHTGEKRIKSGTNLKFFVATDIHYLAKNLFDDGQAFIIYNAFGDGKQLAYTDEIVSAFTEDIEKKRPDVLIISGDLTNNGERESHVQLARKLEKIKKRGVSVYVVPGNHDILNPWARGFRGEDQYKVGYISDRDFSKIYGDFGYNEAISKDKNTLSYLAAPSEDVWLLMLDTAQYKNNIKNNEPQVGGQISNETSEWIKRCSDLARSKGARIITVMHHSLLDHSRVISDKFTINDKEKALKEFQRDGLNLVLSGHIHFQNISSSEIAGDTAENKTYDISTSALSVYPEQYGVLEYSPVKGFDYSTSQIDIEGWARSAGNKDKNLLNFRSYSRKAFGDRSYNLVYLDLLGMKEYSEKQRDMMSKVCEELNIKHFDGTQNVGMDKIRNSPGFKLWEKAPQGFGRNLVMNLGYDGNRDNNHWHIK